MIRTLFILLFVFGCAFFKVADNHIPEIDYDEHVINANWFKIPFRFAHRDQDDNFITHPFFDFGPEFKKKNMTINYFVTTPENSFYQFNFDLYSGKLYKDRNYCPVDDIWEVYKKDIFKPNFTQGIVPQTYDQNSHPQKMIIFSNSGGVKKFKYLPTHFSEARIIGSVLLEYCENYPCKNSDRWKKSQILVGVNSNSNPNENEYSQIHLLNELKKIIDWPYVKSILVNQGGVHKIGNKYFPAFRLSKEYDLEETIKYFDDHSVAIKIDELTKWREGCFKLYDDVWKKTTQIRTDPNNQQLKFFSYFKEFYLNNSEQFYSCQKMVRPATINDNAPRLWFFTFLQAFSLLEKNGFYYNCSQKVWINNTKVERGHYLYDQNKELEKCHAHDFEKSFDQAINGLSLMKNQTNKSLRFVEYDTEHGGSHQKLYSWIEDSGKSLVCKNQKSPLKQIQYDFFPSDIGWENFITDEEKLIH